MMGENRNMVAEQTGVESFLAACVVPRNADESPGRKIPIQKPVCRTGISSANSKLWNRLLRVYKDVLVVDSIAMAKEVVTKLMERYKDFVHACDTETDFDSDSDSLDSDSDLCNHASKYCSDAMYMNVGSDSPLRQLSLVEFPTAYESFGGGKEGKEAYHVIAAFYEICSIDSLISNFILPLKGSHISGKDGRIHCSLNINTETG